MKKLFILAAFGFLLPGFLASCFHHHKDVSVTISDDEHEYEMDASYPNRKRHAVQVYLNDHLLSSNVAFRNSDDEEIILDDDTKFGLSAYPGRLHIKIDKTENPEESCERIREVCEDLRDILDDN